MKTSRRRGGWSKTLDELYGVQYLTGHAIGQARKAVITTTRRLYSMLKGVASEVEEEPMFKKGAVARKPVPVEYAIC